MTYILSIETATSVCSVAIHHNKTLLANQELFLEKSHSSLLTVIINNLISYCEITLEDISAIALSEGPGSYTGLRIGASTCKGLAYSLDIPIIAIPTLEAMCRKITLANSSSFLFCPMIDARRMEVYCLLANQKYEIIEETHPHIIDEKSFLDMLQFNKIVFFGNGADKGKSVITHNNASFIDGITPSASSVGELAFDKFNKKDFVDMAYFEPFYLKEFRPTKPKAI